ncbi:MAG: DsbA family protein [Candidatus Saccharimonadales bacterium]
MQRVKAILAVTAVVFVVALVIFNASRPVEADPTIWNTEMTKGNPEAEKHYIMYTDIFCPYCDKFSNALTANKEDFEANYLNNDKVYFEIRITQLNYLSGHSDNSQPGGESAYCAANQQKFWPYYEAILAKLYEDYHSKGIGVSKTSEKMPDLELSYFYEAAETAELDLDTFKSCVENHDTLEELEKNTTRAQKQIESGVPYFVFGSFTFSGFDGNWDTDNDYKQAKLLLDSGL